MKIAREYYGLALFTALIIFFAFVPYSWSRINSVEYNADNIPLVVMLMYFCGPAMAAFISAALIDDDRGILELLSGITVTRVKPIWYITAIALPFIGMFFSLKIVPEFTKYVPVFEDRGIFKPFFLLLIPFFVFAEELGWRAYALTDLLHKNSPVVSGIVTGCIWSLFYLPSIWGADLVFKGIPFWVILLSLISLSVIMAWVYTHTRHSLLLMVILRMVVYAFPVFFPFLPLQSESQAPYVMWTEINIIIIVFILIFDKSMWKHNPV